MRVKYTRIKSKTIFLICITFRKITASLDRMNCYLKHCEPPEQKDLYIQLIKGVNSLNEKLCMPCPFKSGLYEYLLIRFDNILVYFRI